MKERIAVIAGYRSAMGKAGGVFKNVSASDLGAWVAHEAILRSKIDLNLIDEVIIGNVAQPADSANISRVIALKAGIDKKVSAFTVHRNCASGMEAFTSAFVRLNCGYGSLALVGGVESMSNIPLFYGKKMTEIFAKLSRSKTLVEKLNVLKDFRPKYLTPTIGLVQGLTDPISGLIMGCTAENVARDFHISRQEQDAFALLSHQKAERASANGIFAQEIVALFNNDEKNSLMITEDEGVRKGQKIEDLQKLKPYFQKIDGTVTVGNSSQITDGSAFALVAKESYAKKLQQEFDCEILGYIREFEYAGLEPSRMGLGPVFATAKLLDKTGLRLSDFDLIEINEAFSAQVLGCVKAFASNEFCQENFGKSAIGEINPEILNVNGGAVALGHPVGMSGARIIIHLLRELKRRGKNRGLASLCIGGGQGGGCILEVN
ncbi:MAG: thiolase family protein [Proteobacteria bacterium]|nr:thiolase family protein [Pseudomonadota bacterium]NCA28762.1 thiolase family protein [Pseudomonadota bacterium]